LKLYQDSLSLTLFGFGSTGSFSLCAATFSLAADVRNFIHPIINHLIHSLNVKQNSTESSGQFIILGFGTLLQLFFPCYFASEIEGLNNGFIDDLMATDWIKSELSYKKMILMAMANQKQSRSIKILKTFSLNLETYQKVGKGLTFVNNL